MIFKFLLLATFILPLVASAHSYNPEDLSDQDGRAILCSILNTLRKTGGGDVWPGYDPLDAPLIVKFSDHIFGFGDPIPFMGWKEEKNKKCISYSAPQEFRSPASPLVPYLDFNGTKAFYFDATIKPKTTSWLISTVIHERFHRFQWEHFPYLSSLLSSTYTAHSSVDMVAESFLENHKLTSYLRSEDEKSLIDFLSIALLRELKLSEESKSWELGQQILEGTAVFVQLRAFEIIEKEFGLNFRETWKERMASMIDNAKGVDGVIKWRHYAVGSIVCDYLDRHSANKDWKLAIQTGKKESLFKKALSFTGFNQAALRLRGQAIITSVEGDQMRAAARSSISAYFAEIEKAKNQIKRSRFQVLIEKPVKDCSGGGVSEKTYYLPEGGTLGLNYSGSYQCALNYQEAFTKIAVLQESKDFTYFGLNAGKIWINSSRVPIQDGNYLFKTIKIEDTTFAVQSSLPGAITITGSRISVAFDK